MGRELQAKCKQCRREGTKLFLKGEKCSTSKCPLLKRNYVPGTHGPKLGRGSRLTSYGLQLREKQKAKRTYRILEQQFRGYFEKSISKKGNTAELMFTLLEMRLDNVVYRSGFATSRDKARQLVNHGLITVNGKKVTIPSYQVSVKEKIAIKDNKKKKPVFEGLSEKMQAIEINDWLAVDAKNMTATVIDKPTFEKSKPSFELKPIIEFYSRQ